MDENHRAVFEELIDLCYFRPRGGGSAMTDPCDGPVTYLVRHIPSQNVVGYCPKHAADLRAEMPDCIGDIWSVRHRGTP
jgi:hypothetical protein